MFLAACLRFWAMRTLGRHFSRVLKVQEGHQLITDGPYKYLLHPGYVISQWSCRFSLFLSVCQSVSPSVRLLPFLASIFISLSLYGDPTTVSQRCLNSQAAGLYVHLSYSLLVSRNLLAPLIILMFFVLVYRKRIAAEEDMLVASFGEKYMQCQKKLYRVIPFIW